MDAAVKGKDGSETKVFPENGTYQIEVTSTGYTTNLSFEVVKQADKTELNSAISKAEALNKESYSQDSWKNLQDALAAAQVISKSASATDEEVAQATEALKNAIDSLAAPDSGKDDGGNGGDSGSGDNGGLGSGDNGSGTGSGDDGAGADGSGSGAGSDDGSDSGNADAGNDANGDSANNPDNGSDDQGADGSSSEAPKTGDNLLAFGGAFAALAAAAASAAAWARRRVMRK